MITKDELVDKMHPLAIEIENTIASKQHVFNKHLKIIAGFKEEGIKNKLIIDAINIHLNERNKIKESYFKLMLIRSGYKKPPLSYKNPYPISLKDKKDISTSKTKNDIDYEAWNRINVTRRPLIERLVENGITTDIVQSWGLLSESLISSRLNELLAKKGI